MIIPLQEHTKEIVNHNFTFLRVCILSMTQEEFADWLGITRNMINSYERDKATPSIAILVALDTKLKIDINKLLKDILTIDNFSDFLRTPDATKDYIDSIASQH